MFTFSFWLFYFLRLFWLYKNPKTLKIFKKTNILFFVLFFLFWGLYELWYLSLDLEHAWHCGETWIVCNAPAHKKKGGGGVKILRSHTWSTNPNLSITHHSHKYLFSQPTTPSSFLLFLFLTNTHSSLHFLTLPRYPLHTTSSTIIFPARSPENSIGKR